MLRELSDGVDASQSLGATALVVAGTVIVAIISRIGIGSEVVQSRIKKRNREEHEPSHEPVDGRTPLEIDLMKQRAALEKKVRDKDVTIEMHEQEITRLRDLCWTNQVNPNISPKFEGGTNERDSPTPP